MIAQKKPSAWQDDTQDASECGARPALVATTGMHLTSYRAARDRVADITGTAATPALVRGVQVRLPEADLDRLPRTHAFATDPSLVIPVIASAEDIVRARELRQELRKRYLEGPSEPCSLWSVGID